MRRSRARVLVVAGFVVTAGALAAVGQGGVGTSGAPEPARTFSPSSSSQTLGLATRVPTLSHSGTRSLADVHWSERAYTGSTGEPVDVAVSTSYEAPEAIGHEWADFFSGLVHGGELDLLHAYVAPLPEVQEICGESAVGCYGKDRLIVTNDRADGFAPQEVARHEYGHHIAFNRLNTPWNALDWGPKRWASEAGICARVHDNDVFPGDESLLYRLNPGEAFAEAYRILIDTKLGETHPAWPLVDSSFYPDADALAAVEQDVSSPWTGPTTRTFRGRFGSREGGAWKLTLSTPLDGTLSARLTGPAALGSTLALVSGDAVLASGRSSRGGTALRYEVCGQRSLVIRVGASGSSGRRFELRVSAPGLAEAQVSTAQRRGPAGAGPLSE